MEQEQESAESVCVCYSLTDPPDPGKCCSGNFRWIYKGSVSVCLSVNNNNNNENYNYIIIL